MRLCSLEDISVEPLFGYVQVKSSAAQKSGVVFSEMRLTGGQAKNVTRNSIDRFSAATKDGALYTERTYYGGNGTLEIRLPKGNGALRSLVYACVLDLCRGYLAVGGLTAVGRGIFQIQKEKKIRIGKEEYDLEGLEALLNA